MHEAIVKVVQLLVTLLLNLDMLLSLIRLMNKGAQVLLIGGLLHG